MPAPKKPVAKPRAKKLLPSRTAIADREGRELPKPPGYVFGRPTAYHPDYCATVIAMGELGKSLVQMAAYFKVTRQTVLNWCEQHEAFRDAMAIAMEQAQAYWEDLGAKGAGDKSVDATIWGKTMSARFKEDWKEVKATEHSGKIDTGKNTLVTDILALLTKANTKDLV